MQLTTVLTLGSLLVGTLAFGQQDTTSLDLDAIDATFVTSYYVQDGNHSPVTGGAGTEYLTNTAPAVILNIPISKTSNITYNGGVDFYSSASSDNINNPYLVNHVSGASAHDARVYGTIGYKHKNPVSNVTKGGTFGISNEWDVFSVQLGASWAKESKDHNRSLSVKTSYYFDDWKLIYPLELRNGSEQLLNTDKRHSFNFSATGTTVINKRMNAALTTDLVIQQGLLSTPFHRVYVQGGELPLIEQLPSQRIKVPIGFRFNYNINDLLMLRSHYRFYTDSWGITGNTIKVEVPVKLTQGFRLYPFYRYHTQTAAKYFAPFGVHTGTDAFYTSDYDLSGLSSQKFGLGLSVSPLYGLGRWNSLVRKDKVDMLKAINLRYAYYMRSDGLRANVITLGLDFQLGK